MKVFISWSGQVSRQIAQAIYEWLPSALQNVKPWFSGEIEKGANWQADLFAELEDTKFSIVVLTPEALKSDWIMFETGAAAKVVGKSHACPVLFGLEPTEVSGPLASFQLTRFEQDDFFKLFRTINTALGDSKLDDGVLTSVFRKWWPDLETRVQEILSKAAPPAKPQRDITKMVEETLLLVRSIQNALAPSPTRNELRALQAYRNVLAHRPIPTILGSLSSAADETKTADLFALWESLRNIDEARSATKQDAPKKEEEK
jgi:hypothetical protein